MTDWPLVAVHMSMLSTGKVLVWDGFEAGPNSQRIWDPATGNNDAAGPYSRNLFCSGFSELADEKLFIAGGHDTVNDGLKDSTLWDPNTDSATRVADLANGSLVPDGGPRSPTAARCSFPVDNIQADDSPPATPLSFQPSNTLPEITTRRRTGYTRLSDPRGW